MPKRSGLGRGLDALIPGGTGRNDSRLREIPITSIKPNPFQPRTRFDEDGMISLAASIKEVGLLQPVLVCDSGNDEYELIAGERRWRAARRAGLQSIPAIVHERNELGSLEKALVENLNREDLNPIEEASAYQQLVNEFGYTHEQVAKRVGKSRSAVSNAIRLLQLPAGVQRALVDDVITVGHVRPLLGVPDRTFLEGLVAKTVAEKLSVRDVEGLVRDYLREFESNDNEGLDATKDGSSTPAGEGVEANGTGDKLHPDEPASGPIDRVKIQRGAVPGVAELEELLADYLNTTVRVEVTGRRGKLIVEFATIDDLERLYHLMVAH